jgi:hypothetical protein
MEANRFTKCAHPSCCCTVETEEPFCSAACAEARGAPQTNCPCGHAECVGQEQAVDEEVDVPAASREYERLDRSGISFVNADTGDRRQVALKPVLNLAAVDSVFSSSRTVRLAAVRDSALESAVFRAIENLNRSSAARRADSEGFR